MSFRVGETVGPYRIVSLLGTGGVGRVFKVKHSVTGRVEAMKVLLEDYTASSEQTKRFRREIQLQARLQHPNIASVHNALWVEDTLVMIMELVPGDSLGKLHEEGQVPLRIGLDYIRQALSALDYAHHQGVTHRDISPSNMLVTPEGTLKLTDFGLALLTNSERVTRTGLVMGSAYYMSPEQVQGKDEIDNRTDIYSIGAVLYELATHRKPFESRSEYKLMEAHVKQRPPPPIEINPSLPAALNAAILKALEKSPEQRFKTAEEFRLALQAISSLTAPQPVSAATKADLANGKTPPPGTAAPPEPLPQPGPDSYDIPLPGWANRVLRSGAVQAGAGLAAVFMLIYLVALVSRPGLEPELKSDLPLQTLQSPEGESSATSIASPLESSRLPGSNGLSIGGVPGLQPMGPPNPRNSGLTSKTAAEGSAAVRRNAARPNPRSRDTAIQLPRSGLRLDSGQAPNRETIVELRPTASRLSSNSNRATTFSRSQPPMADPEPPQAITGSGEYTLVKSLSIGDSVQVLSLSNNGRWAAAGTADNSVRVWDTTSGKHHATLRGHSARVTSIDFSPRGDRIATASWDGTAKIWELSSGREVGTFGHRDYVTTVAFSPDGVWLATGCSDRSVKLWNLRDRERTHDYRAHQRTPQALAFNPTSALLASVSTLGAIRLWGVERDSARGVLPGPQLGSNAVAFSPDGKTLAVAGNNEIKLFDFPSQRERKVVEIPGWLHAMTFTEQGRFLVLSALSQPSHTAKLWDVETQHTISTLQHDRTVRSIALSANARRLATAADGGQVSIWEAHD